MKGGNNHRIIVNKELEIILGLTKRTDCLASVAAKDIFHIYLQCRVFSTGTDTQEFILTGILLNFEMHYTYTCKSQLTAPFCPLSDKYNKNFDGKTTESCTNCAVYECQPMFSVPFVVGWLSTARCFLIVGCCC